MVGGGNRLERFGKINLPGVALAAFSCLAASGSGEWLLDYNPVAAHPSLGERGIHEST